MPDTPAENEELLKVDRRRLEGTRLSEKERHDRASVAGNALLRTYGLPYFSALGFRSAECRRKRKAAQQQRAAQANTHPETQENPEECR